MYASLKAGNPDPREGGKLSTVHSTSSLGHQVQTWAFTPDPRDDPDYTDAYLLDEAGDKLPEENGWLMMDEKGGSKWP